MCSPHERCEGVKNSNSIASSSSNLCCPPSPPCLLSSLFKPPFPWTRLEMDLRTRPLPAHSFDGRKSLLRPIQLRLAALQTEIERRVNDGKNFLVQAKSQGVQKQVASMPCQLWQQCGRVIGESFGKFEWWKLRTGDCLANIGNHMALMQMGRKPVYCSLSTSLVQGESKHLFDVALSTEHIAGRLDGIPVYTVCNSEDEFVLVSDVKNEKSLGIFCFRRIDAEALLHQVSDREPVAGRGAKVVTVSLHKVYKLNEEGITFRFLPDPGQIKNALKTTANIGDTKKSFDGVPVFQSNSLILRSKNKHLCPVFFRKEDLELAIERALKQQQRVNPSVRMTTDIQVGSFEDVLKRMESSDDESGWKDVIFIPPGMDALAQVSAGSTIIV